jgi:hypothetical protein
MDMIAATAHFALFERTEWSNATWRSLKLERTDGQGKKRKWSLGWNGERLARNADAAKLSEHHPDVYDWVIESLQSRRHAA